MLTYNTVCAVLSHYTVCAVLSHYTVCAVITECPSAGGTGCGLLLLLTTQNSPHNNFRLFWNIERNVTFCSWKLQFAIVNKIGIPSEAQHNQMTTSSPKIQTVAINWTIILTRRYGTLRRPTSSSCGGLRPSAEGFFGPSGKKRPYYTVLANFRPSLVSSSNLSNF